MTSVFASTHVQGSPEKVFGVFSDIDRAEERISGITKLEKLTEGPVRAGTRFRETRVFFKREATEEMEFTEVTPPKSYTIECDSCGAHYKTTFEFVPEGSGTDVKVTFNSQPVTLFAKLMTPLGFLMSGTLKKCLTKDLEELKAVVESQGSPAPVPQEP